MEHCISTLKLHKEQEAKERLFKTYITDSLMAIAENTTHIFTQRNGIIDYGKRFEKRWIDLVNSTQKQTEEKKEEVDTRSAQEIATDMWQRIRGN